MIGPARFLGGSDENFGNPFVAGEVAQPELHRIHAQIRGDFVHRGFAGEDARQISRRAKIAGSQRPLALLHPGDVRRHDFLVFERVDLAAASGAVQKSRSCGLQADLSSTPAGDSLPIRTTGNCGP